MREALPTRHGPALCQRCLKHCEHTAWHCLRMRSHGGYSPHTPGQGANEFAQQSLVSTLL